MKQQTPIPPNLKDEAVRRPKRAIFPSLHGVWGIIIGQSHDLCWAYSSFVAQVCA